MNVPTTPSREKGIAVSGKEPVPFALLDPSTGPAQPTRNIDRRFASFVVCRSPSILRLLLLLLLAVALALLVPSWCFGTSWRNRLVLLITKLALVAWRCVLFSRYQRVEWEWVESSRCRCEKKGDSRLFLQRSCDMTVEQCEVQKWVRTETRPWGTNRQVFLVSPDLVDFLDTQMAFELSSRDFPQLRQNVSRIATIGLDHDLRSDVDCGSCHFAIERRQSYVQDQCTLCDSMVWERGTDRPSHLDFTDGFTGRL